MKKFIFILLLSFSSFLGYSQLNEDFESAPDNADASGVWTMSSGNWLVRDNRTNTGQNWKKNNPPIPFPANSGTKAAFIDRENTGAGIVAEEWLITPQQTILPNSQFRFFTKQTLAGDTGTKYQIRVSSSADQSDLSQFIVLVEYTETELSSLTIPQDDYEEKVLDLVFSGPRYFAFVKVFTQPAQAVSGDRWLVDDVRIVEKCTDPVGPLQAPTIGATTTKVTWTSTNTQFEIQYGFSGFVIDGPASNTTGVFTSTTSPKSFVLTGLSDLTDYQFYVRSVCADSNSNWVGPFNWTTLPLGPTCAEPIVVTPLPYSHTSNTTIYGDNINNGSPGGAALCGAGTGFLDGNDVVYTYTAPQAGNIFISMNPNGVANTGVFVYANCASIGNTCLAGVGNANSSIREIPSLALNAGQTIYIVVSSKDVPQTFPYTLTVQNATCQLPTNLQLTIDDLQGNLGSTKYKASWDSLATSWEIAVQTAGSTIPTVPGIQTNDNSDYELTTTLTGAPLAAGTSYQYWVRADCGNGIFSPWAGPFLFDTSVCELDLKCNFTFTLSDTGSNGWEGGKMQVIQNGLVIANLGGTMGAVTVKLCDDIPFNLFWSDGGNSADEIRINIKNSFNQQIYAMTTNSQTLIGTTVYSGIVDCNDPLCLPPTGVSVPAANITFNTARINWTVPVVTPLSYNFYVVTQGSPIPNASTVPTYNTTSPPPFTITDLANPVLLPDTNYTVYMQSVCSVNGPSNWTTGTNFKTKERCFKPTLASLNVTLIGTDNARLGWTNVGTATAWEVIVLPAGSPAPLPGDTWTPAPNNPFVYNGLTPDTAYVFYVRAVCGGADGYSSIVGPKAFTTLPTCYKPTTPAVVTASITTTTATLTWVKGQPTDNQWQVLLIPAVAGPNGPVAPPAPTANPDISNGTLLFTTTIDSPFVATGLTSGTIYYYYVRTVCSPTDSSNWTPTAIVFNTLICDPAAKCNYKFVLTSANGNSWNNGRMQVKQNGIVVATLGNTQVNGAPISVGLCPGIPYDLYWSVAGNTPNDIGISVQNPFLDVIYTKAPGEGTPLTILYNAITNCTPDACSKPTGMTAVTTSNSALLSWTENSTPPATQYALYIVLTGEPGPINVPPTPATISPVSNPYNLTELNGLPLTPSTSYTYYVKALCSPSEQSNWTVLTPTIFITKPLNDECLNSRPVPVNAGQTCLPANTISSTVLGATASLPVLTPPLTGPGCGQTNNDVWFSFVAQSQSHSINFSNLVATPSTATINHSVFSGTCDNLIKLNCSTALNSSVSGLTIGDTYFIRVYNASTTANQSVNFDLCITSPPVNDNCDGALDVPVNPNQICTLTTLGNTLGATPSLQASTGANCGTTDDDVWFKFTATNNIHIINTSNNIVETPSTATIAINHSIWSGSCTTGLVNLYCSGGPDSVAVGLTIGDTYYIRAYSAGNTAGQSATFDVCVKTPPPPATNDECATAIPVTVNASSTCGFTTPGNIIGATASLPAPTTCQGNGNDDVWFSFVALSNRHFISLLNVEGTTSNLNHAVYSGACGALTLKYCSDANSLNSNNATFVPGQTYYIRVWSNSAASQVATFDVCVKSVSTCQTAVPFCGSSSTDPFIFENTTGVTSTGEIACLGSNPNPAYFTLHVGETGSLAFNILQNTQFDTNGNPTGNNLDVDFVAWGPFTSAQACQQIAFVDCPTCPFDNFPPVNSTFYPLGNIIDCSYSTSFTETLTIPNAQLDEYYVILITNFNGAAGFIKLVQTNFGESGAGETICCSVGLGPDKSVCDTSVTLNALENPDDPNNVPSTFEWYFNDSTTPIPNETGPLLTVSQAGTYTVKGSCGLNEVEDEIQVTFNVTPTPEVTITQPTCAVLTGTIEVTAPVSLTGTLPLNLYISEVTDEPSGSSSPSLSYVEIFNGTGSSIDLSNYKLKVYTNGIVAPQCNEALTGLIANNTTKIIKLSTDNDQPNIVSIATGCTGVNENDSIVLTTSTDAVVDVWGINGTAFTPLNAAGYDYRRNTSAVAPSASWNAADWTVIDWNATTLQDYSDIGVHTLTSLNLYQYNIDGGPWQSGTTFSNVAIGEHIITAQEIATGCSSSITVNILPDNVNTPVTTFSYATASVCNNGSSLTPDTSAIGFVSGGTYTANPNTLVINAGTGEIDVINSPSGVFVITYSVQADLINCLSAGSSTFTFTIEPILTPDFATPITFCSGAVAPSLALTSPNGITGSWSPATIDNIADGTYVFTPDAGQCADSQTITTVVTPPNVTPDFATPITFCSGTVAPGLALTSPNGITGSWSPATIDNTANGTYVFTPDPGQCATTQTLTTVVTAPNVNPDFATPITFCSGTVAPGLALTSPNGITGSWSPATIDNTADGTYVFTPDAGQCATTQTLTTVVTAPNVNPDFTTPITFCSGTVAPGLALTSPNGVTGSWLPATIDNTADGTYVFTPDAGQCATTQTITTVVTAPNVDPAFAAIQPFCAGTAAPLLATTSPVGITGSWSPATIDNTADGTYIFTPNAGQCAISNTINVTILPSLTSDFATIPTICSGGTVPTLATTSPNGIVGTWSPSTVDPTESGTYTFTPDATINSCAIGQVLEVTIASNPVFEVIGGCLNGNYTLSVTTTSDFETASYVWKNSLGVVIGGNTSSITVTQVGNYTCEVTYQGCTASEPYNATTISCTIQKGISPKGTGDGDGLNDYLDLEGQNVTKLQIFNRYGTIVYSKSNYSKEWYGQSDNGDELPDGTYFYVIERNGEKSSTGWIYINHEL